jgi:exopolysaccharide production protein ExoZ
MAEIQDAGQAKIAALEGMRGMAILLVLMVHYAVAWTILFPQAAHDTTSTGLMADIIFSLGNSGVDLFMALSGYLIYDHLMTRPQPFITYFGRRVRRIFPAYLAVLSVYVVLMLMTPSKSKLPLEPIDAIIYIIECALLIPAFFGKDPIVGISWSLTFEILFYLLLPLLIFTTGQRRRGWLARVVILCCVGGLIALVAQIVGGQSGQERFIMFVGGMLAREALVRCSYKFPRPILVESLALLTLMVALAYMAYWRGPEPFVYPLFPQAFHRSLILCIAFSAMLAGSLGVHGICRRVFEFTPLRLLGEVSFSFYLVHNLAMRITIGAVAPCVTPGMADTFYWLAMPFAFILCLIPGLLLYVLIERPISLRRPIMFRLQKPRKTNRNEVAA